MKNFLTIVLFSLLMIACKSKITNQATGAAYKDVDVAQAKIMIQEEKNLIILDVRTPEETAKGMIENSIEIDYLGDSFDAEISKLDKSKPYLVYCRSGGRSVSASEKMIAAGFTDVTNMKGGYNDWSSK
ncbi:MAG: rhodanese-like domain-containing protein [Saprospiraceae bacterium]|nr:rhodanese-like domain-containing protein [Saprospiraceae bacterium]